MGYTVHAYDLMTSLRKAVLPARFDYTLKLDQVDVMNGFVPVAAQLSEQLTNDDVLSVGNTAIYVVRRTVGPQSSIPFGGVLWTKTNANNDSEKRLGVSSFMSLYDDGPHGARRSVHSTAGMTFATSQALQSDGSRAVADANVIEWDAVDQFSIVADLFAHAATFVGDIGPTVRAHNVVDGTALSGVTRNLAIKATDRRGILSLVKQLAALDQGFDWTETLEWSAPQPGAPPSPVLFLDLWYPRFGKQVGPWVEGRNFTVTTDTASEDASAMALVGTVSSSQNNGQAFTTTADPRIGVNFPLLEFWEQADTNDLSLLTAEANAAATALAQPVESMSVDITDIGSSNFDQWGPGDSPFLARNRRRSQLVSPELNDVFRVLDVQVTVDAQGAGDTGPGMRADQPLTSAAAKATVVNEAASLV